MISCAPSRHGLLSGLGAIDWRLLFNISQRSCGHICNFSQRQRDWHPDTANQDASNGHIL